MKTNISDVCVSAALLVCLAGTAVAQPALVTAPQTLSPGATTIVDVTTGNNIPLATAQITVRNTTLTINGRHSIASLTIENSGVVTHASNTTFDYSGGAGTDVVRGMHLITSGNVTINSNTRIDVSGAGSPSDSGPGAGAGSVAFEVGAGGSYGGTGGSGNEAYGVILGGVTYGPMAAPNEFGSAGGRDNISLGGAGGGAVRLSVGGVLTMNGSIRANGESFTGNESGAGSGGSVWISASTITGIGVVTVNGGGGNGAYSGGGGGGRIAVTSPNALPPALSLQSVGGGGYNPGGAGSVYTRVASLPASVTFSNGGVSRGMTELTAERTFANLVVSGRAMLTHARGEAGFTVQVNNDARIDSNSGFDVSGRGHLSGTGAGSGSGGVVFEVAGGGGHGGNGGEAASGFTPAPGGATYGSVASPVTFGSGGGRDNSSEGGSGGGAVKLIVNGTLTHNGLLSADGARFPGFESGGGAGGSLWVIAGTVTGNGLLSAEGGDGNGAYSGAGGGGRIALTSTNPIPATITFDASGGGGWQPGAAGSVYTRVGATTSTTTYDNKGLAGARTDLANDRSFGNLVITGRAALSHPSGQTGFAVTATGNVTCDANSGFDVTGRGHPSDSGPGVGTGSITLAAAGGGGHGGNGGRASIEFGPIPGGGTYGLVAEPVTFGSGGGRDNETLGASGGGAVKLTVGGTLTNNGFIRSNGDRFAAAEAGGGAGGSVWVVTGSVAGTGEFAASGGNGNGAYSGAGGGGRIAITSQSAIPGTLLLDASGGGGWQSGAAGSVYTRVGGATPTTTYDNKGMSGARTDLASDRSFGNLLITGRAALSHPAGETGFTVEATGNVTCDANSGIDVTGRGHPGDAGPGLGTGAITFEVAGGGGHGGNGGRGSVDFGPTPGGGTYGSVAEPITFGSGGGRDNVTLGASGGGAVKLVVGGILTNNGYVRSNGDRIVAAEPGGGAGGSVWVVTGSVAGAGEFAATGGDGNGAYSGAGGGGRIAITSKSAIPGTLLLDASGGGGWQAGAAGTVHTKVGLQPALTTYDNKGAIGVATDLAEDRNFDSVRITGRATVAHAAMEENVTVTLANDLTIDANSGIDLTGRGFPSDQGPGAGAGGVTFEVAGGGGHGGRGGNGSNIYGSPQGGAAYGSVSSPLGFGSGGGRDNIALGGAGGGSMRLVVAGTATVNGYIQSRGDARTGFEAGGGAGGGLWIQAGTIAGSGIISARGGDGDGAYSGGGGGGRIGIFSCNVTMPNANITSLPGNGWQMGQNGSVYYGSSSIIFTEQPVGAPFDGGALIQLGAVATSTTTVTYQWRKRGVDGNFVPLADNSTYSGSNTSTLLIFSAGCQDGGEYDCLACDSCGCMPSNAALIEVNSTGDFNLDGGVDGADVEAFFDAWVGADTSADVNFDGGVDGLDVEFFFVNWAAGC
jgi:hypothetical protein